MKRKFVMKFPPVIPGGEWKKKRNVVTAQIAEKILILDYFMESSLGGPLEWNSRHCLNLSSDDFETYDVKSDVWKQTDVVSMYDSSMYRSEYQMKRNVHMSPEHEELIKEVLGIKMEKWPNGNIYGEIKSREYYKNWNERWKKEKRKEERINDLMDSLPLIPAPISSGDWIWETIGEKEHYAFWEKDLGKWAKTCCTNGHPVGEKIRHKERVVCSACGTILTAIKRTDRIKRNGRIMILQKIDDKQSVARHLRVYLKWDTTRFSASIDEEIRIIIFRERLPKYKIYYQQNSWNTNRDWWDTNNANRRIGECLLYPEGISEALEGTGYNVWANIFTQMAKEGLIIDYNQLMGSKGAINRTIEHLFKGRFWKLLKETVQNLNIFWGNYTGPLNLIGSDEKEVFGIYDRQKILRIRQADGGHSYVLWMQYSNKSGVAINQETINWLTEDGIEPKDLKFIQEKMTPLQVMNYVRKQQELQYLKKPANYILGQWDDYLSMCQVAKKDLSDEMVYRPRELKRRHDEMIIYAEKAKILAGMDKNPEENKKYADEMAAKFEGAEDNLRAVKTKYEYQDEEYIIIVPDRLLDIVREGNALHHCAGSSERYFERIMQKETFVCFLRRADEPEIPFYTVEIEPNGTIRQHRSYLDEEPGIEQIRPFMRKWQQEIKKRITQEDRELQKLSKIKRKANIEDLKKKNNSRVLEMLKQDFMEVI